MWRTFLSVLAVVMMALVPASAGVVSSVPLHDRLERVQALRPGLFVSTRNASETIMLTRGEDGFYRFDSDKASVLKWPGGNDVLYLLETETCGAGKCAYGYSWIIVPRGSDGRVMVFVASTAPASMIPADVKMFPGGHFILENNRDPLDFLQYLGNLSTKETSHWVQKP